MQNNLTIILSSIYNDNQQINILTLEKVLSAIKNKILNQSISSSSSSSKGFSSPSSSSSSNSNLTILSLHLSLVMELKKSHFLKLFAFERYNFYVGKVFK